MSFRTKAVKEPATTGSGQEAVLSLLMGTELESAVVNVCGKKGFNRVINISVSLKFYDQQLMLLEGI